MKRETETKLGFWFRFFLMAGNVHHHGNLGEAELVSIFFFNFQYTLTTVPYFFCVFEKPGYFPMVVVLLIQYIIRWHFPTVKTNLPRSQRSEMDVNLNYHQFSRHQKLASSDFFKWASIGFIFSPNLATSWTWAF